MVGGVAGGGEDAQAAVGLAAGREHDLGPEPIGAGGVVAVGVGEQDQPDAAALGGRGADRLEVPLVLGPRVDHHTGVRPVEVGVRPFQRHRPRVGGDDPQISDAGPAMWPMGLTCGSARRSLWRSPRGRPRARARRGRRRRGGSRAPARTCRRREARRRRRRRPAPRPRCAPRAASGPAPARPRRGRRGRSAPRRGSSSPRPRRTPRPRPAARSVSLGERSPP